MRFKPSYYSDVAESAAPAAPPSPASTAASMGIEAAGKAIDIGLDKWRASSDAKLAAWASKAEKKKKKAAPPPVVAAPPPPPPSPWAMSPLVKWSLVGMGALTIGVIAYLTLRKKDEEPAPRRNPAPKRLAARVVVKRPSPIRAARTEIPGPSESAGRDEPEAEEIVSDEYESGDEYAGETE